MKTQGLVKFRWLFFVLAAIGIIETPFVIPGAVSRAIVDHRLIIPFVMAFAIRVLVIGYLLKIWWDTRSSADSNPDNSR
jgi:hypothetical protein